MKKIAFLMLATSLITACSSDDIGSSTEDVLATTQTESSSVSVSDKGYLVFPTAQSLQNFVVQYSKDNANASVSLKAPRNTRAVGGVKFESVADLSERPVFSNMC